MRFSKGQYAQLFDTLLSEELMYNASFASQANIKSAMKRILGRSIKMDSILSYSDLVVDESLDVSFKILDPDKDAIDIKLYYGA